MSVSCWKGKLDWIEETFGKRSEEWWEQWEEVCGATCMLPEGHEGPHQWTRDSDITVEFQPKRAT